MSSDHESLWRDPASWKAGVVYYQPRDSRVIVPKRLRFGWTINFAHPRAWPVLLGAMASVFVPAAAVILALDALGVRNMVQYVVCVAALTVAAVIWLWRWGQRELDRKR